MIKITAASVPVGRAGELNYISNLEPLTTNPLAKLPLGNVRARGWVAKQLELMTDGMVGRLKELSEFLADDNGWLGTENDGWEEQPYWFRGFYNLGVLTGDKRILDESQRWIEAIIASGCDDGYFGPSAMRCVVGKNGGQISDLWPHMVMIDALRSYWEVTRDERIVKLLTGFFDFCKNIPDGMFIRPREYDFGSWRPFIQNVRAGDMIPHIHWLYNITGDEWLLGVAQRFYDHTLPPEGQWLRSHVVNFTEAFAYPGTFYAQSGNRDHLEETERWYDSHMEMWGQQPGGAFAADENIRDGKTDPKQGFETCAMAEFNKSFYILARITGEAKYADRVEDIIFNSFPASQTPDLKGLHYLTAANQPQLDGTGDHDYQNKGPLLNYSGVMYRCCQHNVAMGWPYYVENMWMEAPNGGLVKWLYGPSEVTAKVGDGREVRIIEETDYPFETDVRLTIKTDSEVRFPLYLRVPKWCGGFAVKVNGEAAEIAAKPGEYVAVENDWRDGDTVEIEMPVKLSIRKWERSCGSVTVDRGPLSYSLKIGEMWKKTPTWLEDWPDWEVFPTSPWNYGLVFDEDDIEGSFEVRKKGVVADQPWSVESAPIEISAKGKRIDNWVMIDETITDLQQCPVRSENPVEDITLIPMGCARLRISCFPVISDGPDARGWAKVSSHDEAMELRLSSAEAKAGAEATIYEEGERE